MNFSLLYIQWKHNKSVICQRKPVWRNWPVVQFCEEINNIQKSLTEAGNLLIFIYENGQRSVPGMSMRRDKGADAYTAVFLLHQGITECAPLVISCIALYSFSARLRCLVTFLFWRGQFIHLGRVAVTFLSSVLYYGAVWNVDSDILLFAM